MTKKIGVFLMVVVALPACSQRAPWRVVPAQPGAPSTGAARPSTTTSKVSDGSVTRAPELSPAPRVSDAALAAHVGSLYFPVAGMDSTRLDDSYDSSRDSGARRHNAIDIMAPRGSAVLAAQDGRILRLSENQKGGITVWATDLEEQFVYYYAHLDRYHPNLYNGKPLMRGDTLGYVGTTGNAPKNLPHLHFQIMRMPADKRGYVFGEPVNPFPLLRTTAQPHAADK